MEAIKELNPVKEVVVVASYRAKPGKESELIQVLERHVPVLRAQQLITERPSQLLKGDFGTFIEIFEWKSSECAQEAHKNPAVQDIWGQLEILCDFVPLTDVQESKKPFAHFQPITPQKKNRVVHFEIPADDPARCSLFYERVFGWQMKQWAASDYWLASTGSDRVLGIDGAIMKREATAPHPCNTISVPSLSEHVLLVEKYGGAMLTQKTSVPTIGYFAYAKDSEGNVFALLERDPAAL